MPVQFEVRSPPPKRGDDGKDVPQDAVEYVQIGEGAQVVHRKATDEDRAKYADEYAAFKAGKKAEPAAPEASPAAASTEEPTKDLPAVTEPAAEGDEHSRLFGKRKHK